MKWETSKSFIRQSAAASLKVRVQVTILSAQEFTGFNQKLIYKKYNAMMKSSVLKQKQVRRIEYQTASINVFINAV